MLRNTKCQICESEKMNNYGQCVKCIARRSREYRARKKLESEIIILVEEIEIVKEEVVNGE